MEILEEQTTSLFTCPVCQLPYNNPKVLPCLHSFCDSCLRNELPSQSFTLVCPVCRHQFILPPQGISSLQTNVFLVELEKLLREEDKVSDNEVSQAENLLCSSHAGQTLRFYCNDCESAVCSSCTDIAHGDHVKVRLEQAALEHAKALQDIVDISKSNIESTERLTGQLVVQESSVETKCRETMLEIDHSFEKLFQALTLRKKMLQDELSLVEKSQLTVLRQARQQGTTNARHLSDVVRLVQHIVQQNNPLYLLILRKQLDSDRTLMNSTDELEQLQSLVPPKFDRTGIEMTENLIGSSGAVYVLSESDSVQTEISGSIIESRTAIPNKSYSIYIMVRWKAPKAQRSLDVIPLPKVHIRGPLHEDSSLTDNSSPVPGKFTSSSMNSLSNFSEQSGCRNSPSPVRRVPCPIHSTQTTPCSSTRASSPVINRHRKPSFLLALKVRDQGNNTYESVLLFPDEGQYEVNVTLADKHVNGSPFKVLVKHDREQAPGSYSPDTSGRQSSAAGSFQRTGSGRRPNSRLSTSSRVAPLEDDLIFRIGLRGRGKGEFTNPQGVCCTTNGRILATDSNNQCVQIFASTGEFRLRFGARGRSVGQLQRPTGIAVLPLTGQYLIADYENRWISIYEANGKYVSRFGMGKLLGPKGIAVDSTGRIFVVDNKASAICLFQSNGRFIGRFGSRGCSEDHLAGPHFIAINSLGHAIISDFHNHAVKVFDCSGQFLFSFGSSGEGYGQFNAPTGVAVDNMDNILVADWGNSRIQVFDRRGTYVRTIDTRADPLYGPQGLAITAEGQLVVADSGNHCLKVYKYSCQSGSDIY